MDLSFVLHQETFVQLLSSFGLVFVLHQETLTNSFHIIYLIFTLFFVRFIYFFYFYHKTLKNMNKIESTLQQVKGTTTHSP